MGSSKDPARTAQVGNSGFPVDDSEVQAQEHKAQWATLDDVSAKSFEGRGGGRFLYGSHRHISCVVCVYRPAP